MIMNYLLSLPAANEVAGKVMFSVVSVCSQGGGLHCTGTLPPPNALSNNTNKTGRQTTKQLPMINQKTPSETGY